MARKNQIARDLERYEKKVLNEIERIVRQTAELLQKRARFRAAHDTGYLKESIEITYPTPYSALIQVGAEYAVDMPPSLVTMNV